MSSSAVATATSPSSTTSTSSTTLLTRDHKRHKIELRTAPDIDDRDPLPADLRRILMEVGRHGCCAWLPWDDPMRHETTKESLETSIKNALQSQPEALRRGPSFAPVMASAPPRKKLRNGVHSTLRQCDHMEKSRTRKRPLARKPSRPNSLLSTGSGRTSGSEIDDSTQYECDSEGTSATTSSELSVEQKARRERINMFQSIATPAPQVIFSKYKSLRAAIRTGIVLVLDSFYRCRGGYKLTTAELRKHEAKQKTIQGNLDPRGKFKNLSPEESFQKRRKLLLALVGTVDDGDNNNDNRNENPNQTFENFIPHQEGPPFTIQRLAEVLLSPERYYTQTHKLCNCLEKLLLVTSSIKNFGGSTGGETAQTRREEREFTAFLHEKERQESEERNRRFRSRTLSSAENDSAGIDTHTMFGESDKSIGDNSINPENDTKRELLEAAAKAQLRQKFDHIGGDYHHGAAASLSAIDSQDLRTVGGNRSMTTSPPPPSVSNATNLTMSPHATVPTFARHLTEQQLHTLSGGDGISSALDGIQPHSPMMTRSSPQILYSPGSGIGMNNSLVIHPNHGLHLLQMHHAIALAGELVGNSPWDGVIDPYSAGTSIQATASAGAVFPDVMATELENHSGRSSASNSDVDSEGDDFSLDDSASDRSDGSDSGSGQQYEPFTAARVMALNRLQQQQRLQLNRLTTLQHGGEAFRPPADHEYQSGDSIDSMMAEDSGGSDSSSSDLAD